MAVSVKEGSFLWVPLETRALVLGAHIKAPDFWKLPVVVVLMLVWKSR